MDATERLSGANGAQNAHRVLSVDLNTAWYRQLWSRYSRLFWLKISGTTAIMFLFFAAYFHLLRHPAYPAITMPLTAVDALVPFYPPALLIYASLWFYVPLPAALLLGFRELITFGFWVVGLCVTGLLIFYFWPTALLPYPVNRGQYWGFDILRGIDAAGNACPSLHVATAAFAVVWLDRVLKEMSVGVFGRVFNGLWFVAIAYSTMATKQHVFLDVVAGFALGTAFALTSLRYRAGVTWEAYQRQRALR
jgi:membrane-associated phospholipid phosphatase